jgi:hypothetical protein
MYTLNAGKLTANHHIDVVVFVFCSAPTSLIDRRSDNPRLPVGIAERRIRLREGETIRRVAMVASCSEVTGLTSIN